MFKLYIFWFKIIGFGKQNNCSQADVSILRQQFSSEGGGIAASTEVQPNGNMARWKTRDTEHVPLIL